MLSLVGLESSFPEGKIFSGLSMSLLPSSITYVRGLNGTGKTSLLRIISGISSPSAGEVLISGAKIVETKKPYCVYIGHRVGLEPELTVLENLKIWSGFYASQETLRASLLYFGIGDFYDKKCCELSAGYLKKVALSKLLCCRSDIWLLDEPESNLDEKGKEALDRLIISKADSGGIVIIASHLTPSIKSAANIDMGDYRAP